MNELITKIEKRKAFKQANIKIDKTNVLLMETITNIILDFDIFSSESKITNLALLLKSENHHNLRNRFEQLIALPAAPSKKRLELIYVNPEIVALKHKERMNYKNKKRKYTMKQFLGKSNFIKKGLKIENITSAQKDELQKCFDMFFLEENVHVSQSDLWILFDFIIDPERELNYISRLLELRTMTGLHSTLNYKKLRYGEKTGEALYKKFIHQQSKSNSLEHFIYRFGNDLGEQKWNELNKLRSEKTSFNWSEEGFKKRFGNLWEQEYEKWKNKIIQNIDYLPDARSASKSSLAVFLPVMEKIKPHSFNVSIGFSDFEEFNIGRWSYDFTIHELKLIFEFQGSKFHPNIMWGESSEKWNNWTQLFTEKTANEVYAHDNMKKSLAENLGYEVFYIWEEDDVLKNIEFCLNKINEKI